MLKRSFKSIASEIVQAFSFMEAEEYLENEEFDFILLDLILPDGEGDELIEMLPKRLKNKTIVLSGDEDVERRSHVFKLGILDYFSKLNPMPLIIKEIKDLMFSLETNKEINVLIIDDSSFMRKKLKNILTPRQYNLFLAESGEEGLDILKHTEVHLILLDVELNGMSGLEFLETIKKDNRFSHVPVIAVSGNDSPHIIARLLKQGASDFIKKPFIVEQLLLKCDLHIKNYKNLKLLKQKTKELDEAQQVKSRFLANMSHEIRTPLNAIVGFIDLLKMKKFDEETTRYINIISDSSYTLLNVLNDILDLSKIEAGKLLIEHINFDPKKELSYVIDLFQLKASQKNIYIKTEYINLPEVLNSDPMRIKQVLINLLSNAIKFTPEEKNVYVMVKYENQNLYISVKDEGIGMDEETVDRIFHPFTQEDESTTRKYGGTGLGLTISYEIIKLLGGKLEVHSQKGKGSEFSFTIPVKMVKETAIKEKVVDIDTFSDGKVLLVEDNKANQFFMEVILKKLKLNYKIANNGQEAIDIIKNEEFDVILMDENMPIMNGMEATKKLRELGYKTPIVAVTANALSGDKERFLASGFDEYLPKPINMDKLKEVLSKYLK
jgi:signal transduction histidine kinase